MAAQKAREKPRTDQETIAKSAGTAFLGQSAAIIEAAGLLAFTWLYPTDVFGIFLTLWAALKVLTAVTEFAMTTSQQRYTPAELEKEGAARIFKAALLVSLFMSFAGAGLIAWFAPELAAYFKSGTVPEDTFAKIIRLYAWALPFWTLVEVVTASVRAQRAFGPEIRVRIAYEQGLRLVAGVGFFYLGFETFGLFYGHLFSIVLAAGLALKLVGKFYSWDDVKKAKISMTFLKSFLPFGAMMMPANFIKKMFIVGSIIIVNKALGADAAAIYGLGRHISSVLQVVHLSFEYVMAPIASLKNALAKKEDLQNLYAFTTRLIAVLVMPFGVLLIYISRDILTVFRPDYREATAVIIVLTAGRITEALMGTSAAVVEMLGHRILPLINNALGLLTLFILQYYLKVDYGVAGIAVATAVGFNVISLLSLLEAHFMYGLSAWTKKTWHPLLVSLGLSVFMATTFYLADYLPHVVHFTYAIVCIFFALWFLVRFGLTLEDASALGRIGRWFRPKALKA